MKVLFPGLQACQGVTAGHADEARFVPDSFGFPWQGIGRRGQGAEVEV